jgi:hypothetical protein
MLNLEWRWIVPMMGLVGCTRITDLLVIPEGQGGDAGPRLDAPADAGRAGSLSVSVGTPGGAGALDGVGDDARIGATLAIRQVGDKVYIVSGAPYARDHSLRLRQLERATGQVSTLHEFALSAPYPAVQLTEQNLVVLSSEFELSITNLATLSTSTHDLSGLDSDTLGHYPTAIAYDDDDTIIVGFGCHGPVRYLLSTAEHSTIAGNSIDTEDECSPADGGASIARFGLPRQFVLSGDWLFMLDVESDATTGRRGAGRVRRVSLSDGETATFDGTYAFARALTPGTPGELLLATPRGVHSISEETGASELVAGEDLRVDSPTAISVRLSAPRGYSDGADGTFDTIAAIHQAPDGVVFADTTSRKFGIGSGAIRLLDRDSRAIQTLAGRSTRLGIMDGTGASAATLSPAYATASDNGKTYFLDGLLFGGAVVRRLDGQTIETVATIRDVSSEEPTECADFAGVVELDGVIYVGAQGCGTGETGRLYSVDPSTGEVRVAVELEASVAGLAPDHRGGLIAMLETRFRQREGSFARFDPATQEFTRLGDARVNSIGTPFNVYPGFTVHPDGSTLFYSRAPLHEIHALDLDTHADSVLVADVSAEIAPDPGTREITSMTVYDNSLYYVAQNVMRRLRLDSLDHGIVVGLPKEFGVRTGALGQARLNFAYSIVKDENGPFRIFDAAENVVVDVEL